VRLGPSPKTHLSRIAPYAHLEPELALVVEDDEGVGGFAVGVINT
jgi:hypothetical protein